MHIWCHGRTGRLLPGQVRRPTQFGLTTARGSSQRLVLAGMLATKVPQHLPQIGRQRRLQIKPPLATRALEGESPGVQELAPQPQMIAPPAIHPVPHDRHAHPIQMHSNLMRAARFRRNRQKAVLVEVFHQVECGARCTSASQHRHSLALAWIAANWCLDDTVS